MTEDATAKGLTEHGLLPKWPSEDSRAQSLHRSPAGKAADARTAGETSFQWVTVVAGQQPASSTSMNQDVVELRPERAQSETIALIESQGWSLFSKSVTGGNRAAGAAEVASWPDTQQAGSFAAARVIFSFRIRPGARIRVLSEVEAFEGAAEES